MKYFTLQDTEIILLQNNLYILCFCGHYQIKFPVLYVYELAHAIETVFVCALILILTRNDVRNISDV